MAKIALAAAGGIAGFLIAGPVGLALGAQAVVGAVSVGLAVGGTIGAIAFPNATKTPIPIQDLQVSSSADGSPIPIGYNTTRHAGQLIWSQNINFKTEQESQGGSGGTSSTVFVYFANFAIAFGEGPGTINKIWGDSKLIYKAPSNTPGNFIPLGETPLWDPSVSYQVDDMVTYPVLGGINSVVYQAILPSQGIAPQGNSLYWEATSEYPPWQSGIFYLPGMAVDYWGQIYVANTTNPGSIPGSGWTPLAQYYQASAIYPGDELQTQDPTIQAAEGITVTPAFRGLIYVVYENFPLANFGNRIPNFRAEVTFTGANGKAGV